RPTSPWRTGGAARDRGAPRRSGDRDEGRAVRGVELPAARRAGHHAEAEAEALARRPADIVAVAGLEPGHHAVAAHAAMAGADRVAGGAADQLALTRPEVRARRAAQLRAVAQLTRVDHAVAAAGAALQVVAAARGVA